MYSPNSKFWGVLCGALKFILNPIPSLSSKTFLLIGLSLAKFFIFLTCNAQKSVGDPSKRRRRGRPPVNRKQPMIEKIIKKAIRKSSKKSQASRGHANSILGLVEDEDTEVRNIHTRVLEFNEVITQESVDFSPSQMVDLNQTPIELLDWVL